MQRLVTNLYEQCRIKVLRINKSKTAVMEVTKKKESLASSINVEGVTIEQVTKFRYLGSLVSENGKCDAEIKVRIGMAKTNFGKMRDVMTNLSLKLAGQ